MADDPYPPDYDEGPEPHFCESPSCTRTPDCVGFKQDALSTGYYGSVEEKMAEEEAMGDFEQQLRDARGV